MKLLMNLLITVNPVKSGRSLLLARGPDFNIVKCLVNFSFSCLRFGILDAVLVLV